VNEAALRAETKSRKEKELWKCRVCGKKGKPKAGFPLFPRAPWKSRQQRPRFPHFHSSGDEGGWKRAKPKAGFSRSPPPRILFLSKQKKQGRGTGFALRPAAGAPRPA